MKIHEFHQNWHGHRSSAHYFHKSIPRVNRPDRAFKQNRRTQASRGDFLTIFAILGLLIAGSTIFWMHPFITIGTVATFGAVWGLSNRVVRIRHTQGGEHRG